ncbi:MAG: hypothetical protein QQN63_12390, partial [Nitrosopumilus sp.]
ARVHHTRDKEKPMGYTAERIKTVLLIQQITRGSRQAAVNIEITSQLPYLLRQLYYGWYF